MDTGTPKMIAKKENGIGWMIFNSPAKHNAVSLDMWAGISALLAIFAADDAVRAVEFVLKVRAQGRGAPGDAPAVAAAEQLLERSPAPAAARRASGAYRHRRPADRRTAARRESRCSTCRWWCC
mgnify:CR=1 FL=1